MSILTRSKPEKSTAVAPLETPPAPPTEDPAESTPKPRKPKIGKGGQPPALALSPRANLLPPEIGENHRKRATRRGLRMMVVAVLVVVLVGAGGAWFLAYTAEQNLISAQDETTTLAAERIQFNEIAAAIDGIAKGEAAQRVGGGTEIDWESYLTQLQTTLPSDVSLMQVTVDSGSASVPYPQSEIPLEGSRIATLTFTAESPVLPSIPDWINRLSTLPGFADAAPGSVDFTDGVYSASVTMHINTDAYSNRFVPAAEGEEQ